MGREDGTVLGAAKVLDNGPDDRRYNLVLLAEGFQEHEQNVFDAACEELAEALGGQPGFELLIDAFNVHRINVASRESGVDDPADCPGGAGVEVDTYFDASHCTNGLRRLASFDARLVRETADRHVPQWHVAGILINTPTRVGSGGNPFSASLERGWIDLLLHELGHAAFGLADEYPYYVGCGLEDDRDNAPPGEPCEPNVTTATELAELKWRHLVEPGVPIPTMENPDCERCPDQPNVLDDPLRVGLFEGAQYYHCGRYRPVYLCKMNQDNQPFCPVCREAIATTLLPFLNIGAVLAVEGRPSFLRVHDVGTGWGPDDDHLDVEVVTRLDAAPERAFGFQLRADRHESARRGMLDQLRDAFNANRRVRLEYTRTGLRTGRVLRVIGI